MARRKPKCIVCGKQVRSRGLCHQCYVDALAAVKEERTTWEQLEEKGLAAPRKRSPMNKALAELNK